MMYLRAFDSVLPPAVRRDTHIYYMYIGQWDMVTNLVGKYGVVPKGVFPESKTSTASLW